MHASCACKKTHREVDALLPNLAHVPPGEDGQVGLEGAGGHHLWLLVDLIWAVGLILFDFGGWGVVLIPVWWVGWVIGWLGGTTPREPLIGLVAMAL